MKRESSIGNCSFRRWLVQIFATKQKQCFSKQIYHGRCKFQQFYAFCTATKCFEKI